MLPSRRVFPQFGARACISAAPQFIAEIRDYLQCWDLLFYGVNVVKSFDEEFKV